VPTYFRREPGIERSNGRRGSALTRPFMSSPLRDEDPKVPLRREAVARRDALPPAVRAAAVETVAARPFPLPITPGAVVSAFTPIGSEFDPSPLTHKLVAAGARLVLPVVIGRGKPLVMRTWNFGERLVASSFGILEPSPEAAAADPDILLVPLVAFDRHGHRIGYGAGYYDLSITLLRARKSVVAVGLAFAVQEIRDVPATPRDARLDLVLTEREVIDLRGG
jgi:5-formyltetrahydrofolate cyclo-ligase